MMLVDYKIAIKKSGVNGVQGQMINVLNVPIVIKMKIMSVSVQTQLKDIEVMIMMANVLYVLNFIVIIA